MVCGKMSGWHDERGGRRRRWLQAEKRVRQLRRGSVAYVASGVAAMVQIAGGGLPCKLTVA